MSTSNINVRGKMVNAFNPDNLEGLSPITRSMIEKRTRLLGPAYRLFYQNPLQVSSGKGTLLFDRDGNDYLDAYNNVVSVGHAHPKVADAISRQAHILCTHTRYLQDSILQYSEDLLATVDGPLGQTGHTMFTCTGSEANDLALRMAMHYTRKKGVIITSEAYHGNSHLTAGFSPALGSNSPLGTWVRQVPTPDSYRIPLEGMGKWMADQVALQIKDLERHGDGLAVFIADSIFSSDGIYGHPTDLLAPVAEVVRKAGGLFIADEVQSGFCRTGDKFWGYQRHGVQPDIITFGKPMGNGFPVAGLVVAHEIVSKFGNDMRYFNTFGGNSVAIAAAQATLDVMKEEKILENTYKVGQFIQAGFRDLATRFEQIGDVRGAGLYIGVEMVKDRETKEHDGDLASAIVNGLRERRILISATGDKGNTLKIRPPLVFSEADAVRLLTESEHVLKQLLK